MQFELVPKERPVLRPGNRTHPEEYLARLAQSLLQGQLQPIGILKDGAVIWGNGRVLAARLEPKITHLWAAVLEKEITEREFLRMRAVENFVRNDLSNADKCKSCVEYAASESSMTLKQIAADLGVDPSLVTRWMAWEKCIEAVRQALAGDKITLTQMYAISQKDDQAAALDKALNGRGSNGTTRSKLFLPSGLEFTVVGSEMSLEGLREALRDLARLADEAKDVETLCAAMKVAKSEGVTDLDVLAKALKAAKANDQELDLRTLMTVAKGKKVKKGA